MEIESTISQQAAAFVRQYLLEEVSPSFVFHQYDHTMEVVEACRELIENAGLSQADQEVLELAALFHDTGYSKGPEDHEERSAALARDFLKEHNYPTPRLKEVIKLIQSTRNDQAPETQLEKILHDAGWVFLGKKSFFAKSKLLRLEKEHIEQKKLDPHDWNEQLLNLLINTRFETAEAQENYSTRRNKNIAKQRTQMAESRKNVIRRQTGKDFGRGVDTIYRVTLRNHINLSSIADGKANMIININTLVLSILITAGTAVFSVETFTLKENLKLFIPMLALMITSLLAIIFGVLSAIPKTKGSTFSMEDVKNNKASLLFFGNFLQLDKEEFVEYLRELKKDQELLYDDLSRDLYNLGAILRKKYNLLSIAYRVFVGGLVIAVFSFFLLFLIL